MQHNPDIIKLAVEAAGGRRKLAAVLGVSPWAITGWQRTRRMPADKIRRLCEAGGVFTPDHILEYIERNADAEKVAA
jgi:DNA-binding transcriptional regulator YdaS (Cro superfamily)